MLLSKEVTNVSSVNNRKYAKLVIAESVKLHNKNTDGGRLTFEP